MRDQDRRTFLVTGANTGIGRVTATELARRGGRVVLACRNEAKALPVIASIIASTGNKQVKFLPVDLANLASVREGAQKFLARDEPLHVLVNNAGVAGSRGLTVDGFELAFGTNHLGHFLLTNMLLDRLRASGPSRVVTVASDAHHRARGIDFDAVRRPTRSPTGMTEYSVSKLCNVLFTQELARRLAGSGVTTYAVHPGVIASDIWRRVPWPIRPVMTRFMKSPEEGAQTTLWCATSDAVADESGWYYDSCRRAEPSPVATPELASELWATSEAWAATAGG